MSVEKIGKNYYLRMRLFGKQIFMKTLAISKTESKQIEMAVLTAIRSSDYRSLDPKAREFCVRMFQKQDWSLPDDMYPHDPLNGELTLWDAVDSFLNYPEIKASPSVWRHEISLFHFVEHFGKHREMKSLWVPDLKRYQLERLKRGAKPGTINREISTLSRLFGVMIEYKLIEGNPCRLVKRLSEKSGERQVYLSLFDVQRIVQKIARMVRSHSVDCILHWYEAGRDSGPEKEASGHQQADDNSWAGRNKRRQMEESSHPS